MPVACVIANPAAGDGTAPATAELVVSAALAAGWEVTLVSPPSPAGMTLALKHAVATGVSRVIVLGGDGALHLAVDALATTGVELGIIPVGSGNDGARMLGLPTDVPGAIAAALGPVSPVDGLRTDHGWALTVATVGFSVDVNKRANAMRFPRGAARYQIATLQELRHMRAIPLTLGIDGVSHSISATMLAVGNGAYFGGNMQICPAANPYDGLLDITVTGPIGKIELLRFFPTVFKGTHLSHRAVSTYRGAVITLAGDAELWADGEPMGPLPVTLEAVPDALLIAGAAR